MMRFVWLLLFYAFIKCAFVKVRLLLPILSDAVFSASCLLCVWLCALHFYLLCLWLAYRCLPSCLLSVGLLAYSNRSVGFAALLCSFAILFYFGLPLCYPVCVYPLSACLPVSCLPLQVPPTNVGWRLSCLDNAWIIAKGKPRA